MLAFESNPSCAGKDMNRIGALLPSGPRDDQVHRGARRRSSRFPLEGEVAVVEPIETRGNVLNASSGGIRVAVDEVLPIGAVVVLVVEFRSGKRSCEHGRVLWVHEHHDGCVAGIEFVGIA
jgi:hypothetical protein